MRYDVVIVGGGPAGFSAALALGRGRRKVLLCEAGPPRNAAAVEMHGFTSRDGVPPAEFRRIAREELAAYPSVELRDARVERIDGEKGSFLLALADGGAVEARRVLLTVGLVDELPALPGYRDLWGKAIFQCPYCHGYEVRDRAFAFLAPSAQWLEWALLLRGWSTDLVVLTDGRFEVPEAIRARLLRAGIPVEERPLRALVPSEEGGLAAVELEGGGRIAREVLFARPPQRQTDLVLRTGLALNDGGFVQVDAHGQTSREGIYAAGDLSTHVHGALVAAGAGAHAAYMLNHELALSLAP